MLRLLHNCCTIVPQMQHGVEELLQHQRLQLRADEAQQLRHFRSRLAEVEAQLQADKHAAAADQDSWMSKTVGEQATLAPRAPTQHDCGNAFQTPPSWRPALWPAQLCFLAISSAQSRQRLA